MNKADIFIPTINRIYLLKRSLENLKNQTVKDFRIILVGREKNRAVVSLVKSFKNLKIIYLVQKKPGLVAAATQALAHAKNRIFARIDDDVVVDKNWFKNILLTFSQNKDIGAVTGPTLLTQQGQQSRDLIKILETSKKSQNIFLKFFYYFYNNYLCQGNLYAVSRFFKSGTFSIGSNFPACLKLKTQEVENLEACNFACKTTLLKKIGGFDMRFNKGLGDYHEADAAFKIRKLGYKIIFNPKVKVWHKVEETPVFSRSDSFNRMKNFTIFYRRHFKINDIDALLRFLTNIALQINYYLFNRLWKKIFP